MPWPLIELTAEEWKRRADESDLLPGHCVLAPWVLDDGHWMKAGLGANYLNIQQPRRPPILIMLPGDNLWCPDQMAWTSERGSYGNGWLVTGDWPKISITPSINFVGRYHGFVIGGEITDDCEGRVFPFQGPDRK